MTMTAEQMDAAIERRKVEMQQTPCYRCDHKPAAPDYSCPCCLNAHTPDADGNFAS